MYKREKENVHSEEERESCLGSVYKREKENVCR